MTRILPALRRYSPTLGFKLLALDRRSEAATDITVEGVEFFDEHQRRSRSDLATSAGVPQVSCSSIATPSGGSMPVGSPDQGEEAGMRGTPRLGLGRFSAVGLFAISK
jgi:hypothetical protein